jgi:biopolymer transport protein ExbD
VKGGLIFLIGIICILVSCSQAPRQPIEPDFIIRSVGKNCFIVLAGQSYPLDSTDEVLLSKLRALSAKHPEIEIRSYGDTPYRCIGAAISLAQSAGNIKVGFISQPPANPLTQEK